METMRGVVDGSDIDSPIIHSVRQCPTPAAVGGMKGDVESATDTREGGKISERLETRKEVRACNALEGASLVVIYMVGRDAPRVQGYWEREVDLRIQSRRVRVGIDGIATCLGHGASDLREEEREDEGSEEDHCERAGL